MAIRISVTAEDLPQVLRILKDADQDMDVEVTVENPGQAADRGPVTAGRATGDGGGEIQPEAGPAGAAGQVPGPVLAKLNRLASPHDRRFLIEFIEGQIAEHGAVVDPGPDNLKYVRLHLPSHRGAYCYPTTRGFVDFRLEPGAEKGFKLAFARGGTNQGAPYCIRLRLDSEEAMAEALSLARLAVTRLR